MKKHMGSIIIGSVIVCVLVLYMVTFTVRYQEKALVLTFGKISRQVEEPGLQWRWPWQWTVVKFDGRIKTLQQQATETQTRDKQPIIVSAYLNWRINDPKVFYERFRKGGYSSEDVVFNAEKTIRGWIAESANIFAEYNLSELITLDTEKFKLSELEKGTSDKVGGMLQRVREKAAEGYGIEVVDLGIKKLGVPDLVTEAVFNRMKADREAEVRRLMAEGQSEADSTIGDAKSKATIIEAEAEAVAKDIEGKGDAQAAQYYSSFLANPQLANFLRKLETLRKTLSDRTTIVLDGQSPPYTLLHQGPETTGDVNAVPVDAK